METIKITLMPYFVGYVFSIIGSLIFVRIVVDTMWCQLGWTGHPSTDAIRPFAWQSKIVGTLEVFLYTSSWLIHRPEFIGIWLVLKVAPRWGRWTGEFVEAEKKVTGRSVYNIFLVGSGLTVVYAVVGALLVRWLQASKFTEVILAPSGTVVGTIILWLWATYHRKKHAKQVMAEPTRATAASTPHHDAPSL